MALCRRNQVRSDLIRVAYMHHELDTSLNSVKTYYGQLARECGTTVDRLEVIEPTIERSDRDARLLGVYANTGFVVGGILSGVGLLASPITAGTSLALTTAGATLCCAGGATAVGVGIHRYVTTKMNYDEATELLKKFRRFKKQLCQRLLRVHEICEMFAGMRSQRTYQAIIDQLLPEYSALFRSATFLLENFQIVRLMDMIKGSNVATNITKGVYQFVNFVEKLAEKGQKITKDLVTKFLIPLGIVIDTAFLIASIVELKKNRKCEAAEIVALIRDTIQEEMEAINQLCPSLRHFFMSTPGQWRE